MLLGESYWPVRRTLVPRRRLVCSSLRPWPWSRLNAQFYQAGPAPIAGTTTCPESPCLTLALPLSGRRVPSPPRPLLLVHRSYRLIRQSRLALFSFGFAESLQVATSPCCQQDLPVISANPSSNCRLLTPQTSRAVCSTRRNWLPGQLRQLLHSMVDAKPHCGLTRSGIATRQQEVPRVSGKAI